MTEQELLMALVKQAREAFDRLSPEHQQAQRREQAISFVYGNISIENERVTREMVEEAYVRLYG